MEAEKSRFLNGKFCFFSAGTLKNHDHVVLVYFHTVKRFITFGIQKLSHINAAVNYAGQHTLVNALRIFIFPKTGIYLLFFFLLIFQPSYKNYCSNKEVRISFLIFLIFLSFVLIAYNVFIIVNNV